MDIMGSGYPSMVSREDEKSDIKFTSTTYNEPNLGEPVALTDFEYVNRKAESLDLEDALKILRKALEDHEEDPNFSSDLRASIIQWTDPSQAASLNIKEKEDSTEAQLNHAMEIKVAAARIYYHSPYPEVRAICDPTDDPTLPVETWRAYVLGLFWVIVGSGINQFFEPRMPRIALSQSLLQLLLYPCGLLFATLPRKRFTIGPKSTRWHFTFDTNPGPWNTKEQAFVTIMFGITHALAYANHQIYVQRLPYFYHNSWAGTGYQITLVLSTQFLGFGLAGLVRGVLIYSEQCMWPAVFPSLALNRALLSDAPNVPVHGWSVSRYKFFFYCFIGMFFYFWIPGYLFTALSKLNWLTWINPKSISLAAVTGSITGLGINPLPTLDWNVIVSVQDPLFTPLYAMFQMWLGVFIAMAILIPAVWFSNMYNSSYLPVNSSALWTNTAKRYNVDKILTNSIIDREKYEQYAPPFYSAGNLVAYGIYFASYPYNYIYSSIKYRKVIISNYKACFRSFKNFFHNVEVSEEYDDPHSRMMRAYHEAPLWWYMAIMLISLALGIVCVKVYPTEAPVWGIFLGIFLGILFLLPIGLLYAQTNALFSLNVLTELIAGYAFPGKGVALMTVKAFGLNINQQAMYFMQDQKMGHYAKIPPRATFRAQVIATFVQAMVVIGVCNWQINNYADLCRPDNANNFTCPNEGVYFAASVLWGVVGPKRVFESLYPVLKWCFLIGAILPFPVLALERLYKKTWMRSFDPMLLMVGVVNFMPPYNLSYITCSLYVCVFFMGYVKRRYTAWFEKYNYVLSAGFSAGVAVAAIIIFFALQYHSKPLNWWGNTVSKAGQDAKGPPRFSQLPSKGYFGPDPGSFKF